MDKLQRASCVSGGGRWVVGVCLVLVGRPCVAVCVSVCVYFLLQVRYLFGSACCVYLSLSVCCDKERFSFLRLLQGIQQYRCTECHQSNANGHTGAVMDSFTWEGFNSVGGCHKEARVVTSSRRNT